MTWTGTMFAFQKTAESLVNGLVLAVCIWAALFTLQGFGLYTMAKRRDLKHKWLAFVPFVNLLYVGKLAGTCEVFGHKMKSAGVYTMIAQIVTTLCCAFAIFAEIYLYSVYGAPNYVASEGGTVLPVWTNLSGAGVTIFNIYNISDYILSIIELVYQVLLLILVMGLYKRYNPKNHLIFSFLTLFIPFARYFVIFAHRNCPAIDYEAYMRARRDAFIRQQQQYQQYGNPYGMPYGNPYGNPYGGQNQASEQKKPEDPFAEFGGENAWESDDKKDEENTQGQASESRFDSFFE
jgi:hypothetical protein